MIRRLVVFVAVMSSACPQPIADRCGDGLSPCSAGLVCVAGLCARTDADGGLATDAGTRPDAGASDAGSSDAGVVVGCDGGCAPWAVCIGSNVAASCVNGRLEVSEPVDATSLRAGQTVSLAARFVLVDGGAWPNTLAIPVQASWGPQTMLLSGIGGSVPGLGDAGLGSVVFGWDGGPIEPRAVSFTACAAEVVASCDTFLECAPSVSGGGCVSHGYVVEWVSPDAGSATNQASVMAEIRVSKPDGGLVTLTSIPVTGATAFTGAAGRYTGTLPIAAPDGLKTFTAGWLSDGASSTLTLERDTIAPTVSVVVEPRNGPDPDVAAPTAWKKDEKALIKITVDGGRPAVASDVRPPLNGVVTPESCGGCSGACRCFGIDVSSTPLNGLRGPMGVQVLPINDLAGNRTEQKDAGFDVTRLRWVRSANLSSFTSGIFPPTVSESGQVIFAVSGRSPGEPTVQTFDSAGNRLWTALPDQVVTAPVVVSSGIAWIAVSDGVSAGRLEARSVLDGGLTATRCGDAGTQVRSLVLAQFDGGLELPIGVADMVLLGSASCPGRSANGAAGVPTALAVRPVGPTLELFSGANSDLRKFEFQGASWSDQGSRYENANLSIRGLVLDSSGRVGGGGGMPGLGGGVFMVSAADHLDAGTITLEPAMSSAPLLGSASVFGIATTGNLMRISVGAQGLADAGVEASTMSSPAQHLLLGDGHVLSGGVFAGGTAGMTSFVRIAQMRPGDLSLEWSADSAVRQMRAAI